MMKKGKGYPEHKKDTSKGFGDPFKQDVWGGRSMRSSLPGPQRHGRLGTCKPCGTRLS